MDWKEFQAGHYWREDLYPPVRFDEDNVNGQCAHCNRRLSGNLAQYGENLQVKIGDERFKQLGVRKNFLKKHTREDYLLIIHKYKDKSQLRAQQLGVKL